MSDREYLSCAETAKLVRAALKKGFPGVKFGVRSKTYSGGASISIDWIDGPLTKEVDAIAKRYAGGRFDGMIDLAFHVDHYLLPNGDAVIAHSPGSEGSRGVYEAIPLQPMPAGARRVSFGADYVFTSRRHSAATLRNAVESLAARYSDIDPNVIEIKDSCMGGAYLAGNVMVESANQPLDRLVYREIEERANA